MSDDERTLRQKLEAMAAQTEQSPREAELARLALERLPAEQLDRRSRPMPARCSLGSPRVKPEPFDVTGLDQFIANLDAMMASMGDQLARDLREFARKVEAMK